MHPHDLHIERLWSSCREWYFYCMRNQQALNAVKARCLKFGGPLMVWHRILSGDPSLDVHMEYFRSRSAFSELPRTEQEFWQVVQNSPFSELAADKAYEEIKMKREKERKNDV